MLTTHQYLRRPVPECDHLVNIHVFIDHCYVINIYHYLFKTVWQHRCYFTPGRLQTTVREAMSSGREDICQQ